MITSRQLSCSWGGGGPDPTSEAIFQQMAAQGQSFFNASGDSDAFSGTVPFPSDSPNITQVGGTTLDDHRCRRRVCFRDGLELGRRHRQQRRRQHHLRDSGVAAGHQHGGQPGIDHDAKYTRRGADGGQRLCAIQQWRLRRNLWRDKLRRPALGRLIGVDEPASGGRIRSRRSALSIRQSMPSAKARTIPRTFTIRLRGIISAPAARRNSPRPRDTISAPVGDRPPGRRSWLPSPDQRIRYK